MRLICVEIKKSGHRKKFTMFAKFKKFAILFGRPPWLPTARLAAYRSHMAGAHLPCVNLAEYAQPCIIVAHCHTGCVQEPHPWGAFAMRKSRRVRKAAHNFCGQKSFCDFPKKFKVLKKVGSRGVNPKILAPAASRD